MDEKPVPVEQMMPVSAVEPLLKVLEGQIKKREPMDPVLVAAFDRASTAAGRSDTLSITESAMAKYLR